MSKISVIIPCYNAKNTIEQCAASLFSQTIGMENLELIFVNDASTDGTDAVLAEMEKAHSEQVLVVNLDENSGQGVARNVGMQYATGEYIGFVDADDDVDVDMYRTLVSLADQYGCDMAGGGVVQESVATCDDSGQESSIAEPSGQKSISGKLQNVFDVLPTGTPVVVDDAEKRRILLLNGTAVSFAARIYRREFLLNHHLFFLEHVLYEDNYWQAIVNTKVESYVVTKQCFYHYHYNEVSSTNRMSEDNIRQSMQIQSELLDYYEREGLLALYGKELYGKFLKSCFVMNILSAYLAWGTLPQTLYMEMMEEFHYRMAREKMMEKNNPYLWKCDNGLLSDLFCCVLDEKERKKVLFQYKEHLEKGQFDKWEPLFAKKTNPAFTRAQKCLEEYEEGCYLLSLHAKERMEQGTFENETERLLCITKELGRERSGIFLMEEMLQKKECFTRRLEKDSPFLILGGDATCYDVLNGFALAVADCLRKKGKEVVWYDLAKSGPEGLLDLQGQTYRAIVGFQTWLFSVKRQDGQNVFDLIHGPKYHFIFDHPLWMKEHLENAPKRYYVLTHGEDYLAFVKKYFKEEVTDCFLLPPAGMQREALESTDEGAQIQSQNHIGVGLAQEQLDITFIGTWYDYRERLQYIYNTKGRERYLANRFLLMMKKNPNLTAEAAFTQALDWYGIKVDEKTYKALLFEMKQVVFAIMTYYREKVIKTILESGLSVHVYGDSWKHSPLAKNENLICHPQVSLAESLEVWERSKISLNIMSWHKGGFTERIANMLLAGTLAVSDKSDYLTEHFTDEKDMLLFDLTELEKLPDKLKHYLTNEKEREKIAENGKRKALCEHTWEKRTEELLEIIEEENN